MNYCWVTLIDVDSLFENCLRMALVFPCFQCILSYCIILRRFAIFFLPRCMLGHLLLRLHAWPHSQVFEPTYCMEDSLEMMFGRIKSVRSDVKGSTTVANAISSTHLIHTRQSRQESKAGFFGFLWSDFQLW